MSLVFVRCSAVTSLSDYNFCCFNFCPVYAGEREGGSLSWLRQHAVRQCGVAGRCRFVGRSHAGPSFSLAPLSVHVFATFVSCRTSVSVMSIQNGAFHSCLLTFASRLGPPTGGIEPAPLSRYRKSCPQGHRVDRRFLCFAFDA